MGVFEMKRYQHTLACPVEIEDEGVITGKHIRVVLEPAPADSGIVFVREDVGVRIPLCPENVLATEGFTLLTDGRYEVYMIEHLLSALHGLGVDNLVVRIWGEEVPLLDGSAEPFVKRMLQTGFRLQNSVKRFLKVKRPVEISNGRGRIRFRPSDTFKVSARIRFDHPMIGDQSISVVINPLSYQKDVAFARTFGFKDKILELKKAGRFKGGGLHNALILDENGLLNSGSLRAEREFVRHKVLDIIGDLFVTGYSFCGEVEAEFSNHKLHIEAVKRLIQEDFVAGCPQNLPVSAMFYTGSASLANQL